MMVRKSKVKSDKSVKGVLSSTGNPSLGGGSSGRGVTRLSLSDCPQPPSIKNRNEECANNDAERKGGRL